jgi:hypothetical protein
MKRLLFWVLVFVTLACSRSHTPVVEPLVLTSCVDETGDEWLLVYEMPSGFVKPCYLDVSEYRVTLRFKRAF